MKKLINIFSKFTIGTELRQKVTGNLLWLIIDRVIQLGISFFIGVWVARYLGPENFGKLNYAFAFVALLSPLCQLGIECVAIKEFVKRRENYQEIMSSIILLRFFSSIITYILLIFFVLVIVKKPQESALILFAGVMLFANIFDVFDYWFKAEVLSKYAVYARTTSTLLTALMKISAVVFHQVTFVFVLITVIGNLLYNLILMMIFLSKNKLYFLPSFKCIKDILKDSWPLILSAFSIILYMKIDQIMLGNMVDAVELGKYSAAVRIAEGFYFIPMILSTTLLPIILKSKELPEVQYQKRVGLYFTFNAVSAYILAATSVFYSGFLFNVLYGNAFNGSERIFQIYVWANIFVFLGVARSNIMLADDMNAFTMYTTIAGAITNILLNFIFIPKWHGVGAAFATVISYSIAVYISTCLFKKTRKTFILMTQSLLFPFTAPFLLLKRSVIKNV